MKYYEYFENLDKICPLLSSSKSADNTVLFYCVGDNCMWFENYCKPKTFTIIPPKFVGMTNE